MIGDGAYTTIVTTSWYLYMMINVRISLLKSSMTPVAQAADGCDHDPGWTI